MAILFASCAAPSVPRQTPVSTVAEDSLEQAQPAPLEVLYQVERGEEDEPRLKVAIEVLGDADGETAFYNHSAWGPMAGLERLIEDVRATADGRPLGVKRNDAGRQFEFVVAHQPGAAIRLEYAVGREFVPRRDSTEGFYRPLLDEGLMHFVGHAAFLKPEHGRRNADFRVEFVGFEEPGWRVLSSVPEVAPNEFAGVGRLEHELHQAVFCAGPEVVVRTFEVETAPVTVAFIESPVDPDVVASSLQRLIQWQRDFFSDHDYPSYLITLLGATERISPFYEFAGHTGVGWTNGFSAFVAPYYDMEQPGYRQHIHSMFAHELLHNWISYRVLRAESPGEASWFWEGFTTYYEWLSLRELGLVDDAAYVEQINNYTRGYQQSLFRNAPNEQVAKAMWEKSTAKKHLYQRGAVLAALLERQIHQVSQGSRTLDDFVVELFRRSQDNGPVSSDELFELVAKHTSDEFAGAYRGYALDGRQFEIPLDLFGDGVVGTAGYGGVVKFELRDPAGNDLPQSQQD